APDPGAVKRAQRFAAWLNIPVAFVDKRRVGGAEEVQATTVVGDVEGRQAILFDEEIDRGSSVCEAAELLYRSGARDVYAACTHAVFSGPAVERLSNSGIREVDSRSTAGDRKSTRLNSSHVKISYAVFCLNKTKSKLMRT